MPRIYKHKKENDLLSNITFVVIVLSIIFPILFALLPKLAVGLLLLTIWIIIYTINKNKIKKEEEILKKAFIKNDNEKIKQNVKEPILDINDFYEELKQKEINQYKYKIKKGKEYEYYILNFFKEKEYKVYPKGYIEGKKDEGIDLIAHKTNEILLIQCKNWINPPKQKDIKVFITDCEIYINKNQNKIKNKNIRKIFTTNCSKMDYGTKCFLNEYNSRNNIKIEYMIIKMK
ncbi:restriction endonuclease [Campylobacter sp. CCUG 57310]|uniref:restriction endonuclease n=1 Tax=Campylobacter sp. CCUG 57310 TaxID=2517362 RepID=UPI001562F422|nr:restriction endonuclease [Campylobacter sp. CCUG 57310]QKF91759.1 hypothetical protein CORI_0535 [Campylobacter sp. CCUG 57310]